MFKPISTSDHDRYDQACDQAIAMCDGNMRSAIKALLLVNEYLEAEVDELQAMIPNSAAVHFSKTNSKTKGAA
jgi:hypothetical protein